MNVPPDSPRLTRDRRERRRMSLRARLTWVFAVAMAAMLTGLGAFVYLRMGAELLNGVDRNLGARADALIVTLATDPGAPLGGGNRFVDPDEAFAQDLDPSGRILDSTLGQETEPLLTSAQVATITGPTFLTRNHGDADDSDRLLAVPAMAGNQNVIAVVGGTLGDRRDALDSLLALYAVAGPAGLLLTSAAGWLLAGAALRPVEGIRQRAAQLSDTDPTGRLPVPRTGDELSRLATTLNDLLARLHAAVAREHRFVDDASHELRTPLAVLKAELDLVATRPRSAQHLLATLGVAARETDRLVALAEELLVLARARQHQVPPRRTPTHLPGLLAEAVAPFRAAAVLADANICIHAQDITVDIDPDQTRRAIQNLVDNSIRHGRGDIAITAQAHAHLVQIDVQDQGPGFPESLLATAFEPFTHGPAPMPDAVCGAEQVPFPPDRHHGTGLGLAIVAAIAEAHRGAATAINSPHGGATVRLHLRTSQPGHEVPPEPRGHRPTEQGERTRRQRR